jgi:hypothetical protein
MKNARYLLLSIGATLLLSSCYTHRDREYTRSPEPYPRYSYVYYPESEVYYYPARRVYYWHDGRTWRSGTRVPSNYVLRSYVTVNLDSPEPYRRHDQVRVQYPRNRQWQDDGRY